MGDEVQQGLGQHALLAEALDADVSLSLGQLGPVAVEQQRQVSVGRRRPAQRAEQLQVFSGGDQPLGAAQHVTDPHQVIVHHAGQVIGGEAVGLQDDRILPPPPPDRAASSRTPGP